jgi:hypothetical protein
VKLSNLPPAEVAKKLDELKLVDPEMREIFIDELRNLGKRYMGVAVSSALAVIGLMTEKPNEPIVGKDIHAQQMQIDARWIYEVADELEKLG